LDKQSSFWKSYRKRWMVLHGHMLYSFKKEKEYEDPTEIFDLRIYNKATKSSDGKTGQFELSSPNDSRIFLASSSNEMRDWIKHIKAASNRKKKSNSVSIVSHSQQNKKSKNPNTASSKTANLKKKVSSKKKYHPKKRKKNTKPKALEVTNNSMDKHILRMQKLSSAKSKSFEKKSVSSKPKKNHNNLKKTEITFSFTTILSAKCDESSIPINSEQSTTQNYTTYKICIKYAPQSS